MRFLIVLILLAFPFAEIFLLVELANHYGWWLLVYLVVIGYLGLQLIRGEKLMMSAKMMQSISADGNPVKTLLGSARNMIAGVLLVIPGVITDVIAAILLLIPFGKPIADVNASQTNASHQYQRSTKYTRAANDDVIEGEFTEVKEQVKEENDRLK
jgi:UPF0716 protein FxsA